MLSIWTSLKTCSLVNSLRHTRLTVADSRIWALADGTDLDQTVQNMQPILRSISFTRLVRRLFFFL